MQVARAAGVWHDRQFMTDVSLPPLSNRRTQVRVQVSFWLAAVAAIAYLSRTSLAAAEQRIRLGLGLSEEEMGLVIGPAFFWPYALAQIPTAWLGQRYGSRQMLVLFTVAGSLATLAFGLAPSLLVLIVARIAMGISQAGTFPCATQTISHWHPLSERARASGLLGAAMQAGHGLGVALTGVLVAGIAWQMGESTWRISGIGWRMTFLLFAIPGFLWALGFGTWFRNKPSQHPAVGEEELNLIQAGQPGTAPAAASEREPTPWQELITSFPMWMICSQQFFRAAGQVFFASWFATYLQETREVSLQTSAWLTALPVIAMMLASLLGGNLSDRIYRVTGDLSRARTGVAAGSLFLCAVIVAMAYFVDDPVAAACLISLGVFCASFAGPCAYAVTIDMGGRHVPAVFSTMNMIGNVGAGLFPLLVPFFRNTVEKTVQGLDDPGETSWHAVLLLFAAMYLAAALCWTRLRVSGTVFKASPAN